MIRKNDTMEVTVTSLGYGGEGIAKNGDGSFFIPRAVPGDTVRIKIRQARDRYARAELLEVLRPSGMRVPSGCPAFEKGCGGCQWLNIRYPEQLRWKTRLLTDSLRFKGDLQVRVDDIVGMEKPNHCRNKLSLLNKNGRLVFMQENSDRTVFLDKCPQEIASNQKVYDGLKKIPLPDEVLQVHIRGDLKGNAGICLFVKRMTQNVNRACAKIMKEIKNVTGIGVSTYRDYHTVAGKGHLEQEIGGTVFRVPLNGFFQTNTVQAGVLQKMVADAVYPSGDALDLYCGSGFFALPLARKLRRVVGVENNRDAIKNAAVNADINNIENAEFISADVKEYLKTLRPGTFQTIVLDPPRSGFEPDVVRELLRLRPKTILYVSCSPESLARDLKELAKAIYRPVFCRPVDMFPHTFHIETLVKLEIKSAAPPARNG